MAQDKTKNIKDKTQNEASKKAIAQLKEKIEKITKERDDYLNGWKRERAEFINYKKDEAKRLEALTRFANEKLIRELIPILDSFDLARQSLLTNASNKETEKYLKGIYLIQGQLEELLEGEGVKIIGKVGERFDPAFHEAVKEVKGSPPGIVKEVIGRGYILNGKVIRPARVTVTKEEKTDNED